MEIAKHPDSSTVFNVWNQKTNALDFSKHPTRDNFYKTFKSELSKVHDSKRVTQTSSGM
jgi:LPS O-antigen subunit length determinant protein (WzzB/FepE family)